MRSVRVVKSLYSQTHGVRQAGFLIPSSLDDSKNRLSKLVLQHRDFHISARRENPLIVGGIAVIVASAGASFVLNAYKARQAAQSTDNGGNEAAADEGANDSKMDATDPTPDEMGETMKSEPRVSRAKAREARAEARAKEREAAKKKGDAKSGSFFDDFMTDLMLHMGYDKNAWAETKAGFFARNFYDGGFEEKMTKREAALILGVRENTSTERIKLQHRKILLINHPDRGGSPYIAAKINEAKDLLLKGKGK